MAALQLHHQVPQYFLDQVRQQWGWGRRRWTIGETEMEMGRNRDSEVEERENLAAMVHARS